MAMLRPYPRVARFQATIVNCVMLACTLLMVGGNLMAMSVRHYRWKQPMNNRHRRSIRMPGYDYTQPGAYFITLCVQQRECLFGVIDDAGMHQNPYGELALACWRAIPTHFTFVALDSFTLMPNHFHAVVVITGNPGAPPTDAAPALPPHGTAPGSLGAIVQNFKAVTTRTINARRGTPGQPVWQRNYYEHIIRGERDLHAIRDYIENNPLRWALDSLHPNAPQTVHPKSVLQ